MSRSVHWRMTVSDSCNWHQSQALNSTIYILRQTGPTGFLLKEENETKNVKVFLGDPHSCTCQDFKKEKDLCKHICWLLLRKFKLSTHNPLSWQLGLVEREINEILQGHITSDQNRVKQPKKTAQLIDSPDGHNIVEQREIADGDVCPICQEEFLTKKQLVTYCKFGCGNSIHIKCMRVWAEHQLKTSEDGKIKCPMCREDFGPFDLLKTEMRNAGFTAAPAPGIRMDRHIGVTCSHCAVTPIEGKCYRCTICPDLFLCQKCFNTPAHTNHTFQFRQKRNQKWYSASRTLGNGLPDAIANDLMHRDISENDYDLLLQLERNCQEELSSLTEDDISVIPIERVKEGGPLLAMGCQCRICLRGFTVGQFVRKLPCKHKFHKDCIDNWLLHSHPLCPIDGILAVSNQSASIASSQRHGPQPKTTSISQSQACNSSIGDLTLTAFGIPVASSKLKAATSEETVSLDQRPRQRPCPRSSSLIRLELAGLPIGSECTSNQCQQTEMAKERLSERSLLQQAFKHRERISQQVRKMRRTVSTVPSSDELLPADTLIRYLKSELPSKQVITAAHGDRCRISRPSVGSASSVISGSVRKPVDVLNQPNNRQQRPQPLLHVRSNSFDNSIPSIQNVKKVVADLFLGNDPTIQPAVSEHWTRPKLPTNVRPRRQIIKTNFHVNSVHSGPRVNNYRNMDMWLEGNTMECDDE